MSVPQDVRQRFGSTGFNSKSRGLNGNADSDTNQGGAYHGCSEDQKDCQNGVALPLRAAFVGVDINVRHS